MGGEDDPRGWLPRAAEAAYGAVQKGESVGRRGALQGYDDSVRGSYIWTDQVTLTNEKGVVLLCETPGACTMALENPPVPPGGSF